MSVLNKVSEKAAKNYGKDNAALDPATIGLFMELIKQFIALFQGCKTAQAAHQDMKQPRLIERVRARMLVRENMGGKDFRQNGDKVLEALFETGKDLSANEVEELYKEV